MEREGQSYLQNGHTIINITLRRYNNIDLYCIMDSKKCNYSVSSKYAWSHVYKLCNIRYSMSNKISTGEMTTVWLIYAEKKGV